MPDIGIAHPVLAGRRTDPHRGSPYFRAYPVNNCCLLITSRFVHPDTPAWQLLGPADGDAFSVVRLRGAHSSGVARLAGDAQPNGHELLHTVQTISVTTTQVPWRSGRRAWAVSHRAGLRTTRATGYGPAAHVTSASAPGPGESRATQGEINRTQVLGSAPAGTPRCAGTLALGFAAARPPPSSWSSWSRGLP